ncbi:hypothetical protein P4S95_22395 [Aneurinibacillus aneurinilyticus]|uniref:hypothetical protein n=1 Tax=Aneurinibacillus aneurinilyticus TaxID=1391 RepID=UPI002E2181F4|nr:hypothetical protein [Aneurinibacillus aneurinilyticus]
MKQKYIVKMTIIIIVFLFVIACLNISDNSTENEAAQEGKYQEVIALTDPALMEPAQNARDFKMQAAEYMNDLLIAGAELQGRMQGEFKPQEWEYNIEDEMSSYQAAIKHAKSIPKPSSKLDSIYTVYMAIINKYEMLPNLAHKAIDSNDIEIMKVVLSQIRNNEEQYEQLMKINSQERFNTKK